MCFRAPRGTFDLIPGEVEKWQWIEKKAKEVCHSFQYHEVRTPFFEETRLFERGVGETTDIVEKEMYTFVDRGSRSLTLRPEGTAGVVRAFVEKKIYNGSLPTKWYYIGPMFRYERPQAGRNRQFHQFGVEAFGSMDPAIDAEVISLGYTYFTQLGLKNVRVVINSVGTKDSRIRYREELVKYLKQYKEELPEEARSRLLKNPMRILDSKDNKVQEIVQNAPSILDYLSTEDKEHFEKVLTYLDLLDMTYEVNPNLVRGLDYYQQTAFEYMVEMPGSQASTIGGGGRYHGLVEDFGGPEIPGVGFGIGLERVLLALSHQGIKVPKQSPIDCYFVSIGEESKSFCIKVLQDLRNKGLSVDMDYLERKMKAQMKTANRLKARFVGIVGDAELEKGQILLKNLNTGTQEEVKVEHLVSFIKGLGD